MSDRKAHEVHAALKAALARLREAEECAEMMKRKLYRELGCSTIQMYAEKLLGFSPAKTAQFTKLAKSLEALPALKSSLTKGEVSWTKARTIARVATPRTENRWIEVARSRNSRELEREVKRKRASMKTRVIDTQGSLLPPVPDSLPEPTVSLTFSLGPEAKARVNDASDLVTLCSACHGLGHAKRGAARIVQRLLA